MGMMQNDYDQLISCVWVGKCNFVKRSGIEPAIVYLGHDEEKALYSNNLTYRFGPPDKELLGMKIIFVKEPSHMGVGIEP